MSLEQVTENISRLIEEAREGGERDADELWRFFVYQEACGARFFPGPGRTIDIAFDDLEDIQGGPRAVCKLEAMMLDEIEKDPHFAVEVAREMRRIAALADGIELPPL